MIHIFILSCSKLEINNYLKVSREEISEAISQENYDLISNLNYNEAHIKNKDGLIPIEEAIYSSKIKSIRVLLPKGDLKDRLKIVEAAISQNNIGLYEILKEFDLNLIFNCLKLAKETNNNEVIDQIFFLLKPSNLDKNIFSHKLLTFTEIGPIEKFIKLERRVETTPKILNTGDKVSSITYGILALVDLAYFNQIIELNRFLATPELVLKCASLGEEEKVMTLLTRKDFLLSNISLDLIMYAAQFNYVQVARFLVETLGNINHLIYIKKEEYNHMNSLMLATYYGNLDVLKILVEKIKINYLNEDDLRLLCYTDNIEIIKFLISLDHNLRSCEQCSALLLKMLKDASLEAIRFVVEMNPKIIQLSEKDGNLLNHAVIFDRVDLLKLFIDAGANINAVTSWQATALWTAASMGKIDCLELLLKAGADINKSNYDKRSPLLIAILYKKYEIVERLIEIAEIKIEPSMLFKAIELGDVRLIEILLKRIDVNVLSNGNNGLILACSINNQRDGEQSNLNIIELLIQKGINVNFRSEDGNSALRIAAIHANIPKIELLIKAGAITTNVYPHSNILLNGLNFAGLVTASQETFKELPPIVKLMQSGLNIHSVNDDGMTNFYHILKGLTSCQQNFAIFFPKRVMMQRYNNLFLDLMTIYGGRYLVFSEEFIKAISNINELKKVVEAFGVDYVKKQQKDLIHGILHARRIGNKEVEEYILSLK